MTERDFVLECFVNEICLTDTAAAIDGNQFILARVINIIQFLCFNTVSDCPLKTDFPIAKSLLSDKIDYI